MVSVFLSSSFSSTSSPSDAGLIFFALWFLSSIFYLLFFLLSSRLA